MAAVIGARALRFLMGGLVGGLLSGCGTQGMSGELSVPFFPQSGLGGFRLLTSDQAPDLNAPYILLTPGLDIDEPTVWPMGDGLLLWVSAQPAGQPDGQRAGAYIGQARVERLLSGAGDLSPALVPDQPWEKGALLHPTLIAATPGPPLLLLYQGLDGSVGAAPFGPDGMPHKMAAARLLSAAQLAGTAALGSVSGVVSGGTLRLYYLVHGGEIRRADADLAAVMQVTKDPAAGLTFTVSVGPLLHAADFIVPQSISTSLPAERLSGLSARRVETPTGRERYDLFLVAEAGGKSVACAASSYDGATFLPVAQPILPKGVTPSSPTVLTYQDRALLLLGLRGAGTGIAAAQIP